MVQIAACIIVCVCISLCSIVGLWCMYIAYVQLCVYRMQDIMSILFVGDCVHMVYMYSLVCVWVGVYLCVCMWVCVKVRMCTCDCVYILYAFTTACMYICIWIMYIYNIQYRIWNVQSKLYNMLII